MRSAVGATVVLLAILPFLRGDSPPAKPTIEQLIEQLNNKSFPVRQAAEKAIEELGPEALPALRKALAAKPNLEVSRRIEKWIPQFELAALSNPKRITLDVKGRPLEEIVETIAKQSGYPIALQADADKEKKPCDLKLKGATFWDALDALCVSEGMTASRSGDSKGFQLQFSDRYQPYVHRHGAFRVVGQGFQYSYSRGRGNQFGDASRKPGKEEKQGWKNESESLQFTMFVEAEPGVLAVGLGDVVIREATDDQKKSLAPEAAASRFPFGRRGVFARAGGVSGHQNLQAWVPLKPPSKDAKKVTVLKGMVAVQLEKEKKTTVLAEKFLEAKGKKFNLGKTTIEIGEVRKGEDQDYDLYLTMAGRRLDESEMEGELKLLDEKGNAYRIAGSSSRSNGKRTRLHLSFVPPFGGQQVGPATKLVYVTRVTMDYALPFEFRDLPLP